MIPRTLLQLAFLLTVGRAVAQEDVLRPGSPSPWTVGIELGGSFSFLSRSIAHSPLQNPSSPISALREGSGLGGFVVAVVEYRFSPRISLGARSGIELKRFSMAGEGVADCPGNRGDRFDTVRMRLTQRISQPYLTQAIFLAFEPDDRFGVIVGPVLHTVLGFASIRTRAAIISEGECVFSESGEKVLEREGTDSTGINGERWGIEAGIWYRLRVGRSVELVPGARFQYMFTPFAPNDNSGVDDARASTLGRLNYSVTDQSLHSLLLGISVRWTP